MIFLRKRKLAGCPVAERQVSEDFSHPLPRSCCYCTRVLRRQSRCEFGPFGATICFRGTDELSHIMTGEVLSIAARFGGAIAVPGPGFLAAHHFVESLPRSEPIKPAPTGESPFSTLD